MFGKINETLCALLCWLKANHNAATKDDLNRATDEIVLAVNGAIEADVQRALDALLRQSEKTTKRMEKLAKALATLDALT